MTNTQLANKLRDLAASYKNTIPNIAAWLYQAANALELPHQNISTLEITKVQQKTLVPFDTVGKVLSAFQVVRGGEPFV